VSERWRYYKTGGGAKRDMVMAGFYLFAGIVAADLLIYLVTALLFPEDFL
jgi:K+-transporting ATPase KdpF subunit